MIGNQTFTTKVPRGVTLVCSDIVCECMSDAGLVTLAGQNDLPQPGQSGCINNKVLAAAVQWSDEER